MKLPGLYQKTDSRIWYYQPPQSNGVRPRPVSLRTKDPDIALQRYNLARDQAKRQHGGGLGLAEMNAYLDAKSNNQRHVGVTSESARGYIQRFIDWAGNRDVSAYDARKLDEYRAYLQGPYRDNQGALRTRSVSTIQTTFTRLGSWFSWLVNQGKISTHPLRDPSFLVELPKIASNRAELYCTREERELIMAECARHSRDIQFVFWMGFFAGMRLNEILEARPEWIDLTGGQITVERTETFTPKGKRARKIPIGNRLRSFLESFPLDGEFCCKPDKRHGKSRYRWECRSAFRHVVTTVDLEWVTAHTMRHTFATLHAMQGTPLGVLAGYLGDSIRVTEDNYIGYTRERGHGSAID